MDRKTIDLIKKLAILVVLACLALYFKYNETSVDDKYTEISSVISETPVQEKTTTAQKENNKKVEKSTEESKEADVLKSESEEENADAEKISNGANTETVNNNTKTGEADTDTKVVDITYKFRNAGLWEEHFEKHGEEFPYSTKEEYLEGANIMMENPDKLHKTEKEDGDDVYYLEATNEFIIVSKDGYLRTYFKPSRGKAYYDKQ